MESLLREIETIARRAGAAIMEVCESAGGMAMQYKDDDSPLTEADKRANAVIAAGLAELEPRLPVLSEESAQPGYEIRRQWRRYWLVDPLDDLPRALVEADALAQLALAAGHGQAAGLDLFRREGAPPAAAAESVRRVVRVPERIVVAEDQVVERGVRRPGKSVVHRVVHPDPARLLSG